MIDASPQWLAAFSEATRQFGTQMKNLADESARVAEIISDAFNPPTDGERLRRAMARAQERGNEPQPE